MTKLAIIGANGRMGSRIIALASGFEVVGKVTRTSDDLGSPDVIVDFSSPEATRKYLDIARDKKIALLIGTTGLSKDDHAAIDAASGEIAILQATNTSVGVAVLNQLVSRATKLLGEDCTIDIVETHHQYKKDAPSGTAISLRDAVGRAVPIKSIRQGEEIGTHQVNFVMEGERIELTHRALDRDVFARGALRAASWLATQKPGRYQIADAFGSAADFRSDKSI